MLFVDQRIINATDDKERQDKSRVVMSMVSRDGRWLVDDLKLR